MVGEVGSLRGLSPGWSVAEPWVSVTKMRNALKERKNRPERGGQKQFVSAAKSTGSSLGRPDLRMHLFNAQPLFPRAASALVSFSERAGFKT